MTAPKRILTPMQSFLAAMADIAFPLREERPDLNIVEPMPLPPEITKDPVDYLDRHPVTPQPVGAAGRMASLPVPSPPFRQATRSLTERKERRAKRRQRARNRR